MTARGTLIQSISDFLQHELGRRHLNEVPAVEAATWLDDTGLLHDSATRPGKPLRDLLRDGVIDGSDQRPPRSNGRWFIVRQGEKPRSGSESPAARDVAPRSRAVSPSRTHQVAAAGSVDALADAAMTELVGSPATFAGFHNQG